MKDTDDYEVDVESPELMELDVIGSANDKEYIEKRDIRAEIEKKLELKELRRLTEDSYNDFVFD